MCQVLGGGEAVAGQASMLPSWGLHVILIVMTEMINKQAWQKVFRNGYFEMACEAEVSMTRRRSHEMIRVSILL